MPTSDLDLPLLPSADQIRRREFATVRRGYDPDQVRDYLYQVADQIQVLERDLREARLTSGSRAAAAETNGPTRGADPYEQLAARFSSIIHNADTEAQKVVDEAKVESVRMIEEARTEADRIRVDAQARAEEARQQGSEALEQAREEAEKILGGLATRRETLVAQMHEMQSRLLSVAQGLEVAIEPDKQEDETQAALEPIGSSGDADPVDPRYEDLWVSDDQIDIPDLASIDLDIDEDSRGRD